MAFQTSGQFSFNGFRSWWVGAGGSDFGAHLKGWEGAGYVNPTSGIATWPSSNMHMFLFYGVAPNTGGGGGK